MSGSDERPTLPNEDRLIRAVEEVRDELRLYREWYVRETEETLQRVIDGKTSCGITKFDWRPIAYAILLSLAFLLGAIAKPFD